MRLLLICALDVWSLDQGRGAPTLERTLRAYSDAGHTIDAVLPDVGANRLYRGASRRREEPETRPRFPGVAFHTFHMPSIRELPIPSIPAAAERIDQKLRFAIAFPWLRHGRHSG